MPACFFQKQEERGSVMESPLHLFQMMCPSLTDELLMLKTSNGIGSELRLECFFFSFFLKKKALCLVININRQLTCMTRGPAQPCRLLEAHLLSPGGGCGAADVDQTSDLRPAADSALRDALIGCRRRSKHVEEEEPQRRAAEGNTRPPSSFYSGVLLQAFNDLEGKVVINS